eukprot:3078710-Rhodomonas_salina.2
MPARPAPSVWLIAAVLLCARSATCVAEYCGDGVTDGIVSNLDIDDVFYCSSTVAGETDCEMIISVPKGSKISMAVEEIDFSATFEKVEWWSVDGIFQPMSTFNGKDKACGNFVTISQNIPILPGSRKIRIHLSAESVNGIRCGENIINAKVTIMTTLEEECDDGNTVDGDECDHNCQTEVCGNGVLQPHLGEECDDWNTESGDGCSATCVAEFCGDNIINNNNENCDDGNTVDGDGCDNNCQTEVCGNGVPQVGEECDDGNTESVDGCTSSCMYEQCPKSMDTGWSNACAVTSDGGVSFWGQMSVQMPKGSGAKACATQATGQPVCVLFDTGDVKCWSSSQFSNITLGGKKAVQLECDQFGCCALLENNYLQCFNVRFFLQYFTQFVPDGGHHLGDVPVVQVATL